MEEQKDQTTWRDDLEDQLHVFPIENVIHKTLKVRQWPSRCIAGVRLGPQNGHWIEGSGFPGRSY